MPGSPTLRSGPSPAHSRRRSHTNSDSEGDEQAQPPPTRLAAGAATGSSQDSSDTDGNDDDQGPASASFKPDQNKARTSRLSQGSKDTHQERPRFGITAAMTATDRNNYRASGPESKSRDDKDLLARVRSQFKHESADAPDSNLSSSLSSAPPLLSSSGDGQICGLGAGSASEDGASETASQASAPSRSRRGALASKMRTKAGTRDAPPVDETDDEDPREGGEGRHLSPSEPRLHYASSLDPLTQSSSSTDSEQRAARTERHAATERKRRLLDLAAKKRRSDPGSPTLEDEFFHDRAQNNGHGDDDHDGRSRSPDSIRSSSDADASDDGSSQPNRPIAKARDDDSRLDQKQRQHQRRRSRNLKHSDVSVRDGHKVKAPKQLSKKELEQMHKMTAQIERNRPVGSLALQSHPVARRQYDIAQLAAKFSRPSEGATVTKVDEHDDVASSDPIEGDTPRAQKSKTPSSMQSEEDLPSVEAMLAAVRKRRLTQPSTTDLEDGSPEGKATTSDKAKREEVLRLRKARWWKEQEDRTRHANSQPLKGQSHGAAADEIEITGTPLNLRTSRKGDATGIVDPLDLFGGSDSPVDLASSKLSCLSSKESSAKVLTFAQSKNRRGAAKSGASGPPSTDLRSTLLEKIKLQNIQARSVRGHQHLQTPHEDATRALDAQTDDIAGGLSAINARIQLGDRREGRDSASDQATSDSDSDSDFADSGADESVTVVEFRGKEGAERDSLASSQDTDLSQESDIEEALPPSSQNTDRSSWRHASRPLNDSQSEHHRQGEGALEESDDDEEASGAMHMQIKKRRPQAAVPDDEDESHESSGGAQHQSVPFQTDGGLTQFFQSSHAPADIPESQLLLDQEERLKLPSEHQETQASDGPVALSQDNSVLGQFFADTQLSATPRGQSLDVIGATGRARNAEALVNPLQNTFENHSVGALSQFFNEGTQDQSLPARTPREMQFDSMPPPLTIPTDGFAALRRQAQHSDDLLASPGSLPSPVASVGDDGDIALPRPMSPSRGPSNSPKQYLNHEGFFTQTKPVTVAFASGSQWTPSQAGRGASGHLLSPNRDGFERSDHAGKAVESPVDRSVNDDTPTKSRRRRFRRGRQSDDSDQDETSDPHVEPDGPDDEGSDTEQATGAAPRRSEREHVGGRSEANAWDALRRGAKQAAVRGKERRKDHQFIEGEAEESEDEEKAGHVGGLDGVFSESEADGEDDESDDDDRDLEELVNNERELDEAEKDKLARQRFQQDVDLDEAAALALAEKAARGDLRTKRRGVRGVEGGLDDLLDDDFDEERLMRRANNPKALMAKRRKIEGDGMDLLAARSESQAFVQGYAESYDHSIGEEYGFLAGVDNSSASEEDDEDDGESTGGGGSGADAPADRGEDSRGHGAPNFSSKQTLTRKQLAEELRERRKRRKARPLSDEDDVDESTRINAIPEAQRPHDPFASDDSGDEALGRPSLPSFLRDRIASGGRAARRGAEHKRANQSHDPDKLQEGEGDEGAGDDPAAAILAGIKRKKALSPQAAARFARLAEEYKGDSLDVGSSRRGGGLNGPGGGASVTSFKATNHRTTPQVSASMNSSRAHKDVSARKAQLDEPRREVSAPRVGILALRNVEESQ
ncbi:unnamed protein product [Parajaminaea phylloscopi]